MAAGGTAICFICLDSFNPSDVATQECHGRRRSRRSRKNARHRQSQKSVVDNSGLLQKFCGIITDYLQLPSLELQEEERSSSVCPGCFPLIISYCDLHEQLRAVELRIAKTLAKVGEIMMDEPEEFNECLSKLAEQLRFKNFFGPPFVEKIRSAIALKCVLKGKEVELNGGTLDSDDDDLEASDNDGDIGEEEGCHQKSIKTEPMDMDNVGTKSGPPLDDSIADFDDNLLDDEAEVREWSDGDGKGDKQVLEVSDDGSESSEEQKITKKRKKTATPGPAEGKQKELDTTGLQPACQLCKKALHHLTRHEYSKHIYAHEEKEAEKKIQCNFCWMSFAFPQSYMYHLKIRHDETNPVFPCENEHCDLSFSSVDELNSHLKTHSGVTHFCSTCNWAFLDPNMKALHELIHVKSVRGNFPCSKCDSVLHGFQKYRDHYNLRHGAQLKFHKCKQCSVTCLSHRSLKNHMKRHDEANSTLSLPHPPQCCDLCGQTYKGPKGVERLQRHMENKHGEDQLACSICDQTFHCDTHMDKHMKTVHGLDKLPCEKCDKKLGSTRTLRDHMRIVHAVEPEKHLCTFCGLIYRDVRYLEKHVLWMHSDLLESEGKYPCGACGKKFRRKALVKRHTCSGMKQESNAVASEGEGGTMQ